MAAIPPSNSRGMGWRKPVPVFVPTPPPSRPTSGGSFTPASAVSGVDTGKQPPAGVPEDGLPPMPDNWLSIVRSVSQSFYHDSTRFHLTARTTIPESQPVCAEFSRTASSMMDDHSPHSSRSHYIHRGALPKVYRPPTPPIPSVRRPRSCALPSMLEAQTSLEGTYRVIYPDPPSIVMQFSHQSLRQPSLFLSESTRKPTSVKAKPSLQSLVSSSEGHTAVSSHGGMSSRYLHDDLKAKWNLGLAVDLQNEKQAAPGGGETDGKSELPMHYLPASKLRKKRKQQRSCSDMLWSAMISAGRAIASVFKTDTYGSGLTVAG
ncbi:hypothetical protein BJV74DRAFT_815479 [Russula compacta]|nr:hypothetical protein BJV74DRAFT_815479 [Russula compacta]